ncbi:DUF6970 domain-containing protein [Roseateles sp.]|uniref:DUF6970 domain-containing protein n=1 Tax=Roseateles sp. TaxID=1971397 RepID=UPI002DFCA2FC|nr:hypothetical protein [Roseateles sp.]
MPTPGFPPLPRYAKAAIVAVLALAAFAVARAVDRNAAEPPPPEGDPAVREQIRRFEAGTLPPVSGMVSMTTPEGRRAYLIYGPCCDHWNRLYDAEARLICAPSGGFTGEGDGKCPAWVHEAQTWRRLNLPGAASGPAPGATGL